MEEMQENQIDEFTHIVEGREVRFPHKPYNEQLDLIKVILNSIEKEENALLESPTGSGKTLTLLSAALSYQQHNDDEEDNVILYATRTTEQINGIIKELNKLQAVTPNQIKYCIYSSRQTFCIYDNIKHENNIYELCNKCTASQRNKSNLQGKNSSFSMFNQNQDQNQEQQQQIQENQKKEKQQNNLNQFQNQQKLEPCPYYNEIMPASNLKYRDKLPDIEDLKIQGKEKGLCPYFFQKKITSRSKIILLTYNYIFNPQILKSLQNSLKNRNNQHGQENIEKRPIVIIDEAHNTEESSCSNWSFKLKKDWIFNIQNMLDQLWEESKIQNPQNENEKQEKQYFEIIPYLKFYFKKVLKVFEIFEKLLREEKQKGQFANQRFLHFSGTEQNSKERAKIDQFIYSVIQFDLLNDGYTQMKQEDKQFYEDKDYQRLNIEEILDNTSYIYEVYNEKKSFVNIKKNYIEKYLQSIHQIRQLHSSINLRNIDRKSNNQKIYNFKNDKISKFNMSFEQKRRKEKKKETKESFSNEITGKIYKQTMIFIPYLGDSALKNIKDVLNPKSILLASGSLKPFEMFKNLGVKFQTQFENKHVINSKKQVFCQAINTFQNQKITQNQKIIMDFGAKNYNENKDLLLKCLQFQISYLIQSTKKGGIVVFFSSYARLKDFKNTICKKASILDDFFLANQNIEYKFESYKQSEFKTDFKYFVEQIMEKDKKMVFFGVSMGKLSEGIDLADNLARCIIIAGLPYLNFGSQTVQAKMKYFDKVSEYDEDIMEGNEWYRLMCAKQINQVLGRGIRHKDDYCSLFIIDSRINGSGLIKHLPEWVQKGNVFGEENKSLEENLKKFWEQDFIQKVLSDCLICLDNQPILMYTNCCSQPIHSKCAQGWKTQKGNCPQCRHPNLLLLEKAKVFERVYKSIENNQNNITLSSQDMEQEEDI